MSRTCVPPGLVAQPRLATPLSGNRDLSYLRPVTYATVGRARTTGAPSAPHLPADRTPACAYRSAETGRRHALRERLSRRTAREMTGVDAGSVAHVASACAGHARHRARVRMGRHRPDPGWE